MTPDAGGRHCTRCDATVVDLTRMTRSQARNLPSGKMCGRVRVDARGEIVLAPEPVRAGLVPMALAGLLAACSAESIDEPTPEVGVTADAQPTDVALAAPIASRFGGSLATGVMMPIGPRASTPPVAIAPPQMPAQEDEPVVPTAEQRALTRRKHQRQHPPILPPPHTAWMGMMVMDD